MSIPFALSKKTTRWRVAKITQRSFKGWVYCLSTPPYHHYIANGIITHNCIYPWAGADSQHLIELPGDVKVLGQSWRVPPVIQKLALSIIGRINHRRPKQWQARAGGAGEISHAADISQVDCGAGEILVLARNVYLVTDQIIPALRRQGVVYEWRGHPSIAPNLLRAITAWERLRGGGDIDGAEARLIYALMTSGKGVKRGFKTLPHLRDDDHVDLNGLQTIGGLMTTSIWHEAMDRIPEHDRGYIIHCRQRGEKLTTAPRVRVSTIHGAKGGEANHVVLLKEMARRTYKDMEKTPDAEARVQYVAVTRAKERLTIVDSRTQQAYPWL
jgi:DNA helicase-2/ATP-dependent DNA helicase PcrA